MKKLFVVLLAIVLVSAFFPAPAPAQPKWELKYSTFQPASNIAVVRGHAPFAKMIEEATKGRVKVTLYPGGTLAKAKAHYDALVTGIVDIAFVLPPYTPGRFPISELLGLPFLGIRSAVHGAVAFTGLYEKFPEEFEGKGREFSQVKPLVLFCPGPYHLHTNKPIRAPEDIKGMKIRAAGAGIIQILKAMGAVPVLIPIGEIYTSLEKGVIDGTLMDDTGFGARKFVEVTKYHTQLSMYTFPFLILMNKRVWNNFPEEIQKQIMSVSGTKGAEFLSGNVWDFGAKKTAKMLSEMKGEEIIRLSDQELKVWGKYSPSVHQKYIADLEAKGIPGRALYDELLRQIQKYK